MNNGEYLVQLQDYENFYTTKDAFGAQDGFMIAAAVTNFDGSNVDITDPEIGEIKFYLKQWDVDVEGYTVSFKEIESKVCTDSDLNDHKGSNSDVSAFNPVELNSVSYVKQYGPGKMRCIKNLDDLQIWGNYDTDTTSNLMVVFEKCDITKRPPGAKCKDEGQIEEWMQFKYILTLENEVKFIQHLFGEKRIDQRSRARQYALNPTVRSDFVRMIYRSQVHFSDSIINVSGLLNEEEMTFVVSTEPTRQLPYKNRFQNSITYEMSLNKQDYFRKVNTVLDLLGDVGGLMGALTVFCSLIISCFQHESSYQFIMNDMFIDRKDGGDEKIG